MTLTLSIGIPAYNEERNMPNLLDHLLAQKLQAEVKLEEIIIVASGCTDKTVDIVKGYQKENPVVKLIIEEKRGGHASAVNKIIEKAQGDIVIFGCADTQPEADVMASLAGPFLTDSKVGAVVGRAVPVNNPDTLWGYMAHRAYEWNYLPQILMVDFEGFSALRRSLLEPMPLNAIYTERLADVQIRRKGFKVVFAPDTVSYTKQPDNLGDFIKQRRRNTYMHLMQRHEDIPAPHIEVGKVIPLLFRSLSVNPKKMFFLSAMIILWGYAFILGWRDYKRKVSHLEIWEVIPSAKNLS